MSTELQKQITRGTIAQYARDVASLNKVSNEELVNILIEISQLLKPQEDKIELPDYFTYDSALSVRGVMNTVDKINGILNFLKTNNHIK